MPAGKVTVRCPVCSRTWAVEPRADGTYPTTARCAKGRGGCGRTGLKVPRPGDAKAVAVPSATAVVAWDPPSPQRLAGLLDDPCPHCGEHQVHVSPRGTVHMCFGCRKRVTPPGALAPYKRGTEVTRAAKSQRERDDDAKETVLIAGEFLRQVRAMLDDPQIHPASADLLGWYEEEIAEARKNRDGRRLAELGAEFSADREARAFRRRHWWQGGPAALGAAGDGQDGEDGYVVRGEVEYDRASEPAAVVLADPASIAAQQHRAQQRRMTWADAIAACGWRLSPVTGGCQIVDEDGGCRAETAYHIGSAWICGPHHATLGGMITSDYQHRQQRSA